MRRLERDIQSDVSEFASTAGLLPIRINVVGRKGWPDYGYVYRGRIVFVEFKRPGERPEPLQLHVHARIRANGADVFVVDNTDYGNTLLKEWKHNVDQELARIRNSYSGNARSGPDL